VKASSESFQGSFVCGHRWPLVGVVCGAAPAIQRGPPYRQLRCASVLNGFR
jgi:hypothetical protein